jgi:hypothetical protein
LVSRENPLLSGTPLLWDEARGMMSLEECGLRGTKGCGIQEDQIAFRGREDRFFGRSFAAIQQE